jgi:hypothetical protein
MMCRSSTSLFICSLCMVLTTYLFLARGRSEKGNAGGCRNRLSTILECYLKERAFSSLHLHYLIMKVMEMR